MTQAERDRLVALKNDNRNLITQKQAAEEVGVTERQVRRLRKLRGKEIVQSSTNYAGGRRTGGCGRIWNCGRWRF